MEAEILRDMEQEQAHKNCRRRQAVSTALLHRGRAQAQNYECSKTTHTIRPLYGDNISFSDYEKVTS